MTSGVHCRLVVVGDRYLVSDLDPEATEVNLSEDVVLKKAICAINPTLAAKRGISAESQQKTKTASARTEANRGKSAKAKAKAKATVTTKPTSRASAKKAEAAEREKLIGGSVDSLRIQDVPLPSHAVKMLSGLLAESTTLHELCLVDDTLLPEDLDVLMEGVLANRSLRVLDLQANSITQQQIEPITRAIIECPALEHVNLCLNQIGKAGTTHLLEALSMRREVYRQRDSAMGKSVSEMEAAIDACKRHGVSPERASPLKNGCNLDDMVERLRAMGQTPLLKLDLRGNIGQDHGIAAFEVVTQSPPHSATPPHVTAEGGDRDRGAAMRFLLNADEHVTQHVGDDDIQRNTDHTHTESRFDDLFAAKPAT